MKGMKKHQRLPAGGRKGAKLAPLRRAITDKPRPMVNPIDGYGVIWAAKSACSSVALWHFSRLKMLEAAMFYHPAPHKFRAEVVEKSHTYRKWLERGDPREIKWYWVVRDPVNRALSSFRHNIRFGYDDDRISEALGRVIKCADGYSFNDFLTYLESIDVHSQQTDFHVRSQQHRLMKFMPVRALNIDVMTLEGAMNMIEAELGLDITEFANLKGLEWLASKHHATYTSAQRADCDTILNADMARQEWPFTRSSLDEQALARLKEVYAADFVAIGEGTGNIVVPAIQAIPGEPMAPAGMTAA